MAASPTFEFHVSRAARDLYGFDDLLFSVTGNVVFANLPAARQFAYRMNLVRDAKDHPQRMVYAGALNVMGLIDEAQHLLIARYREERDPPVMLKALEWFQAREGRERLETTLLAFVEDFPPVSVYRGQQTAAEWIEGATAGVSHRAIALEELIFLWLANVNPAYDKFKELFDDEPLAPTAYKNITASLRDYFDTRPRFGPENENVLDILRAPALAAPDSIAAQLAYIRDKWLPILGEALLALLRQILTALDVLQEEEIANWLRFHPGGEPGAEAKHGAAQWLGGDSSAQAIPRFDSQAVEYEAFSPDIDWMPRTVMIAKTVYVWLDQLSKAYGRPIYRLNDIPDEELDTMARRGFNALWLIGLWERSRASQRIKQLCGNPEAVASAYSLYEYSVAADLGGESAYSNLRDRARLRGIRLASDMVPNHMGIDSRWVVEHPDWFLSLPHSPFPAYTFEGPDLSRDGRVEIKIEDHYFSRSDAAVVFRRRDRWSGETRFIYHGNDGTSFPWNDTAQLNYLNAEVREALVQTILHVARMFPIIRFDAAMTLAKRHFQRLWFPEPGTGGAIPSRAEYGMTKAEFDAAVPREFWREVVDRVSAEVPGTLLLAEAFWLMEGYFVRTLGMHRVYNSAFMNMMRDEENANYRSTMKNTLEFDPDVLKRYVNFMNNPDERTAVDQFGKGDKYFGVCTLMATLPGLPMFGHGQIEGYNERYGMEYRRAYYDESPDPWLVARHEREISPLLHRRALFAEVAEFLLYDFYAEGGYVDENVFAYSNRRGSERALVVYNNRYGAAAGWVRISCQYAEKHANGEKRMRQRTLGESFGLSYDGDTYLAYRDAMTGLEYLQRARDVAENGLRFELGPYKSLVLLDWRDLKDDDAHPWGALCDLLSGRGVTGLDEEMRKFELAPVHAAWHALLDPAVISTVAECGSASEAQDTPQTDRSEFAEDASQRLRVLLEESLRFISRHRREFSFTQSEKADLEKVTRIFRTRLKAAIRLPALEAEFSTPWPPEARRVLPTHIEPPSPRGGSTSVPAVSQKGAEPNGEGPEKVIFGTREIVAAETGPADSGTQKARWAAILAWCALEALGRNADPANAEHAAARLFDGLRLREPLAGILEQFGLEGEDRWRAVARLRIAFAHSTWAPKSDANGDRLTPHMSWLHDPEVAWVIGVHEYQGARYFVKEPFEELLWWMALRTMLNLLEEGKPNPKQVRALENEIQARTRQAERAGYRVEALLELGR